MRVLLPEPTRKQFVPPHPVLYLLHGLTDDESAWTRFSGVERYVRALNLAVVMPNVHRSYYCNMMHGYRYWDFVSEELPLIARALFPLSARREQSFVAGLSMGGYGALKLALRKPEAFAAVASFSACCDLSGLQRERPAEFAAIFGDAEGVRSSGSDLRELARELAQRDEPKPKILQTCGREDPLLCENRSFRDFVAPLGLDYEYEESPGQHDWAYWDAAIQRVLHWLPLQ